MQDPQTDSLQTDSLEAEGNAATAPPGERASWWLSLRRHGPEWQALAGAGQATFSGRPRAHFEQAGVGDPVLIYVSRPERAIRAVGVVTAAWADRPAEQQQGAKAAAPWIEVQRAFELASPLSWHDVLAAPTLAEAEPVRQRSSTMLLHLGAEEYRTLQALILARNPELEGAFAAVEAGAYVPGIDAKDAGVVEGGGTEQYLPNESTRQTLRESAPAYGAQHDAQSHTLSLPAIRSLDDLQSLTRLPIEMLSEARELLESTGQIVLSGPPGTGKTWLARGLASLLSDGDPRRAQVVQFHPSTSYEDFIEGLKPQVDAWGRVTYAVVPGIFVRICRQARNYPEHSHVLLVDEMNRAPLSRVFGELLYALEYRGPQGTVELSLSAGMGEGEAFYVPRNLLLIGTMNSADRSLAMVDYALRRRFRFIEIEPDATVLDSWLAEHGADKRSRSVVLDLFREVNARLTQVLDPDHRLGHAYFMLDPFTPAGLDRLWRTAVKPLITEYFVPSMGEVEEYGALFAEAVRRLGEE